MCCCSRRCQGAEVVVVVEVGAKRFFLQLLSSAVVVVVVADLDRRPWRGEDSSDWRYWNVEFYVRSRSRMFCTQCTQIHSRRGGNTYTHSLLRSCVLSLWKLNVFNLQTSRTAASRTITQNFFLSTLCKTTKSHA